MIRHNFAQLLGACRGQTVLVAAPGDSFSALFPVEVRRADAVLAINLAVSRIEAADYWFVVDDPKDIRDEKRREQFLNNRTQAKLICPSTSTSWRRDLWEFRETRPFQHQVLPVGTVRSSINDPLPLVPCFSSASYGAVVAAFAMGAAEVRMVGIDHGRSMNQRPDIAERLRDAYRLLVRWTRMNGRVLTQCNPESSIQPSTY